MLHVLNGDATREQLLRSGVRGTLTVWADALHEGPVPAGLRAEDLRQIRVSHFAGRLNEPEEPIAATARRWDDALDRWMGGVHLTPQTLWRWDGSTLRSEP